MPLRQSSRACVGKHFPSCIKKCLPQYMKHQEHDVNKTAALPQQNDCVQGKGWQQSPGLVLVLSLHKTSLGSIVSGDSILWSNSHQQQNRHLRACQKVQVSGTRKKRGWGGCVCVRREQKFQLFQSQVISLFPLKIKISTSILFFLPVFPRER